MRFVIYGAGAVGAVIGGRLAQNGNEVVFIARGAHADALQENGLTLETHDGTVRLRIPVVRHPSELTLGASDVVILAVKTQDANAALEDLIQQARSDTPLVCVQNGVEAERLALRRFDHVHGVSVMVPAVFLKPGFVQAFAKPVTGVLDVGRYPSGRDALSERLASAFRASGFDSQVRDEILAFKYGKLLFNLGNAIEAVCGPHARKGPIAELVKKEALAAFEAGGVAFDGKGASARAEAVVAYPLGNAERPGGSSWQSLARGTGSIETDYLNGEVVLIGRTARVPTPANALLQRLSNELARERLPPGGVSQEEFLRRLQNGG